MKLICIGRNYAAHIDELKNERPAEPVVFFKPDTAVLLEKQPFFIPDFSRDVQHEVEVLVRINRVGRHIQEKFAYKYYNEIGLGIDFTARDIQQALKKKGLPWEKAKGFDGAAVVGNFLPKDSLDDINDIPFCLKKNGQTVQQGNTRDMLWRIDELIAYVSTFVTLKIGDIIFTGTPEGVGRVSYGDVLKGYIGDNEMFSIKVK